MNQLIKWVIWDEKRITETVHAMVDALEAELDCLSEEDRERARVLIDTLRGAPPSTEEIRNGTRSGDLSNLAFALGDVGAKCLFSDKPEEALRALQMAHELFRVTNVTGRPSKPMRRILMIALKAFVARSVKALAEGETDAGDIQCALQDAVCSAWGTVPAELELDLSELLLTQLEAIRQEKHEDQEALGRIIRNNIETVLAMEVPARLTEIQDRWISDGVQVAPDATRVARRRVKRPQAVSEVLSRHQRNGLQRAIEKGDSEALLSALEPAVEALEANLVLRLDAKADFMQPLTVIRFNRGPDSEFENAKRLLLQDDSEALQAFRTIHYHKSGHAVAKEWCAYALKKFGGPGDIHEIITLLEEAIVSSHFKMEYGWVARWNLACALRALESRKGEALDILLPVLNVSRHPAGAFELCLRWAIEDDRQDVLRLTLIQCIFFEAQLLVAYYDLLGKDESTDSASHFTRINRILADLDRVFPDPVEELDENQLDQLTRSFVDADMVDAGLEWFRQRFSNPQQTWFYKNWACAAELAERKGDLSAAWEYRLQQWHITARGKLSETKKCQALRFLITWARRNDFKDEALRVLKEDWQKVKLPENEMLRMYHELTGTRPQEPETEHNQRRSVAPAASSGGMDASRTTPSTIRETSPLSPAEAEQTIQSLAGEFTKVATVKDLAQHEEKARRLLAAVQVKHPGMSAEVAASIRTVLEWARELDAGVEPERAAKIEVELRGQLQTLRANHAALPFELREGLSKACQRAIEKFCAGMKSIPGLNVTPPSDLGITLDPESGVRPNSTLLLSRLVNPGTATARNVSVAFSTTSRCLHVPNGPVAIPDLAARETRIVECLVGVDPTSDTQVDLSTHVTCEIDGLIRTTLARCHVPLQPVASRISQRYTSGAPVPVDRQDLFHGRDKELMELMEAFSGNRLQKLYFVNGIRRVGKTTLMKHLCARFAANGLSLLFNLETALSQSQGSASELALTLAVLAVDDVIKEQKRVPETGLSVPGLEEFEREGAWFVLDRFLDSLRQSVGADGLMVCFDEMQVLVKRIADPHAPMDDSFLTWLRDKIQNQGNIFLLCTGSVPYRLMRKYHYHNLWGNMAPYDISFVDREAMEQIAKRPVEPDGVVWLPESLDLLWDMTEGHPWIIQILCETVMGSLNEQHRRIVSPGDVERAASAAAKDELIAEHWWNVHLVTEDHEKIAHAIVQNQAQGRSGLPETALFDLCDRLGVKSVGRYLEEMKALEVLSEVRGEKESLWRIRGAFLERHLSETFKRKSNARPSSQEPHKGVALLLDWENVKISLDRILGEMTEAEKDRLRSRLAPNVLAKNLLTAAAAVGKLRQRWAVANWDHPGFGGHQKILSDNTFFTGMAGTDKADASDHVLRERIHDILRDDPETDAYIIGTGDGDFFEAIRTLQRSGKYVTLWATRNAINGRYYGLLDGPDKIQIQYLEDLVFTANSDG